jgi:hypothetical protein
MHHFFSPLSPYERAVFKKLNTPAKIQDYLETLPFNFEKRGETLYSPHRVLSERKAHCFEGALFAAAALWYHGYPPIILDLLTAHEDDSHVVALFKKNGKWGAVSKTNHAVLRYREPVYKSPREVAMSYFHEYFLDNGKKTLRSYATFDLSKIKKNWMTDKKSVYYIDKTLNKVKHNEIISKKEARDMRKADPVEIKAGKIVTWKKGK